MYHYINQVKEPSNESIASYKIKGEQKKDVGIANKIERIGKYESNDISGYGYKLDLKKNTTYTVFNII